MSERARGEAEVGQPGGLFQRNRFARPLCFSRPPDRGGRRPLLFAHSSARACGGPLLIGRRQPIERHLLRSARGFGARVSQAPLCAHSVCPKLKLKLPFQPPELNSAANPNANGPRQSGLKLKLQPKLERPPKPKLPKPRKPSSLLHPAHRSEKHAHFGKA